MSESGSSSATVLPSVATVPPVEPPAETDAASLPVGPEGFHVRLDAFEGPFDLLLSLIAKHKLDVTELALAQVTDDFIAHIRSQGENWDLGETTEFLVVAATLLDLKAARLLPSAEVENEDDLALLEARDLLFARLLQYRAFKEAAAFIAARIAEESRRFPRAVGLDDSFASVLPEVVVGLGADELAQLAARVLAPKPLPAVGMSHLHAPRVSVREQASVLVDRLRRLRTATFRALTDDSPDMLTRIARFLALLELFREGAVAFDQVTPLGELNVRWIGSDDGEIDVDPEFDPEFETEFESDEIDPAPDDEERVGHVLAGRESAHDELVDDERSTDHEPDLDELTGPDDSAGGGHGRAVVTDLAARSNRPIVAEHDDTRGAS